jgi:hypothetical protein
MFLLQQAEVAENMKGDFVGIELVFMYKDSAYYKTSCKWSFSQAGIKAGDRFYMQTKRSWKKVTFGRFF